MRAHTGRKVSNNGAETLKLTLGRVYLREPKRCKRYNKDSYPLCAVQRPTRQQGVCGNLSGAAADAERLSRGFLADFPNEAVVIKMEQCRSGHDPGENPFNDVDAHIRLGQTQPTVGEHQAYINAYECATAPEHETHKPTDRAVALHSFTIINPNEREVLHIVEHFEQCNADENACHNVIAVPPKGNARNKKHDFYRTRSLPLNPHPNKIHEEHTGNCQGERQQSLLCCPEQIGRNKRSSRRIITFQGIGHPLRRKKDSGCKPDPAHSKIEATR